METLDNSLRKKLYGSFYALLFLSVLLGLSVLLEGCGDTCETTHRYVYYEPVYHSLEDIRSAVKNSEPSPLTQVGKIYFKDQWLFINEPGKGIHVIDNTNPAKPVMFSFIEIPGNYDLAVKGNTLYADSYIDLVVIDITDKNAIREASRLENVFSTYNALGFTVDASKGLVTDWVEKSEVKVYESDCDAYIQPWGGIFYASGIAMPVTASFDKSAALTPGTGSGPGAGGSMARFTINGNYLYALDAGDVQAIDVTIDTSPEPRSRTPISWDMETIFPYKENLFIGSQTGMHIVDVSTPDKPVRLSTYSHVRVCDPVVVQGTVAYVTLRSGTQCDGFTNQLEVIDISNLQQPSVISTFPMTNPHGLGIDGSTLFVCDGDAGLKVFDASVLTEINKHQLAHYDGINAFDVIPFNNVLMMIGSDGIFQYDYSDPKKIKLLSKIDVVSAE